MCVRVPCALGRAGSEILHRFPWLRVAHTGSHSCICPESPCYLSMSHTGPATRLALPLLLYNSTAPKAQLLSLVGLPFVPLHSRQVEWKRGVSGCQARVLVPADAACPAPSSCSAVWIDALQALARRALCGARLLNGYTREAFHWIHYVGRPIRGGPAAVALETGAGWSGPCWWIVNEFVIHKNGEEFPLRIKWVQTNRRTAGRRKEEREAGGGREASTQTEREKGKEEMLGNKKKKKKDDNNNNTDTGLE